MSERIAKIEQRYAARKVEVGETFDVHPSDVRVLLALGRIVPIQGEDGYVAPQAEPEVIVMPTELAAPIAPAEPADPVDPVEPAALVELPKPEVATKAVTIPRGKSSTKKKAD